jgi:hypothetical protein
VGNNYKLVQRWPTRKALNDWLTSVTLKRMLSVQKFSGILKVIGREIQPGVTTDTGPTPENGCEG